MASEPGAKFDWDEGNRCKCRKHGVGLDEIETLFGSSGLRVAPDVRHSEVEQRFLAIGRSLTGRSLFVVFTWRGDLIRPLSARYMHAREVQAYEDGSGI